MIFVLIRNPDVNSVVAENNDNDANITSGTVVSLKYSRPVVGLITCAKRIGGGSLDWYIIDHTFGSHHLISDNISKSEVQRCLSPSKKQHPPMYETGWLSACSSADILARSSCHPLPRKNHPSSSPLLPATLRGRWASLCANAFSRLPPNPSQSPSP